MCEKWYEIFKYFLSNIGLRQGENLSPTLFHLLFYGLTDSMSKTYNVLLMFIEYHIYLIDNNDIEVSLKVCISFVICWRYCIRFWVCIWITSSLDMDMSSNLVKTDFGLEKYFSLLLCDLVYWFKWFLNAWVADYQLNVVDVLA